MNFTAKTRFLPFPLREGEGTLKALLDDLSSPYVDGTPDITVDSADPYVVHVTITLSSDARKPQGVRAAEDIVAAHIRPGFETAAMSEITTPDGIQFVTALIKAGQLAVLQPRLIQKFYGPALPLATAAADAERFLAATG